MSMLIPASAIATGYLAARAGKAGFSYGRSFGNYLRYGPPTYATGMMNRQSFFRKKGKNTRRRLRLGQIHSLNFSSSHTFDTATPVKSVQLSAITLGDVYNQRKSNNILSRNVVVNLSIQNNRTRNRFLRVILLQLRGSSDVADTTNWTDLLINDDYSKTGPTSGASTDLLKKVNQDEYKVITDRMFKVTEFTSEHDSRLVKFFVPTKKIIKYEYNSNDTRRGAMFLVMFYTESAGLAGSADNLDVEYNIQHNYTDVDKL